VVIDILQMAIVLALGFLIMIPLGRYMAAVFMFKPTFADGLFNPIDNLIYRVCRVNRDEGMRWPGYIKAMLLTNLAMWVLIFATFMVQHEPLFAALNPDGQGMMNPFLAFMQASSFITNTDWQNYGGESTFSYMSQMFGLIFPMFTSAATGLACGVAFIRGLGGSVSLGNFYVDLTRGITRVMLPISLVVGIALVGFGIPATFDGAQAATTLNGPLTPASPTAVASPEANASPTPEATPSLTSQGQQSITRGPVAPLSSIKHLGTNGGGFFNANSAHPFENPSPVTNVIEILLMGAIPASIIYMLGIMLDKKKQAWTFFGVLAAFYTAFLAIDYVNEKSGNPLLSSIGVSAAQGNMEGKEVRFGQAQTALFANATTAFTTGSVDSMHDSMTPGGSVTPFSNMFLNMVFGGKGVGFINLFIFVVLGVFMTGLMVGRTPELLGKKIEVHEVKLASLAFLMHPLLIFGFMALTFALQLDLGAISNPGPHGFSEVMYAYTSMAANNGSAFAGLSSNTNWYNVSGGITVILGRYISIVLMLALAGSMAAKKTVPMTIGTMRTDNRVFAGVLVGTVLIIGALTFFPVMALGPIADHLAMVAGQTFQAAGS